MPPANATTGKMIPAGLLTWVLPGLGHWWLGHRALGVVFFLAISFALCVGFDLLFPYYAMHESWQALLPAFTWISWGSFALGAAETFFYGWYAALLIGPIYNFCARG